VSPCRLLSRCLRTPDCNNGDSEDYGDQSRPPSAFDLPRMCLPKFEAAPYWRLGRNYSECATFYPMTVRLCTVSFKAMTGITHAVEVEAESVYEAAGLGLARLKRDGWVEGLGPATKLEIQVREPATTHVISVDRLTRWVNGTTVSPGETLRRARVRHLIGANNANDA
jgi:hypothetical protein